MTILYLTNDLGLPAGYQRAITYCGEPDTTRVHFFRAAHSATEVLAEHKKAFPACTCTEAREVSSKAFYKATGEPERG